MAIVTISRLRGSGGNEIGRRTAEELGYTFVNKQLIESIFKEYGLIEFSDIYDSTPGFWHRYDQIQRDTMQFLEQVLKAIAKYGKAVIVGRGSYTLFQGYSDVLNVQLWAPFGVRLKRVMEQEGSNAPDRAAEELRNNDRIRKNFVESCFKVRREESHDFDLTLNTAKIRTEGAVELIVQSVRGLQSLELDRMQSTSQLEVDPVLLGQVGNSFSRAGV